MSSYNLDVGHRLREVRLTSDFSQAKTAARLGIADRTYKFYELGKREVPLSTAIKFCAEFSVELKWLATGTGPKHLLSEDSLVEEAIVAVISALDLKGLKLGADRIAKQVGFVLKQTTEKGTSPMEEAEALAELIS